MEEHNHLRKILFLLKSHLWNLHILSTEWRDCYCSTTSPWLGHTSLHLSILFIFYFDSSLFLLIFKHIFTALIWFLAATTIPPWQTLTFARWIKLVFSFFSNASPFCLNRLAPILALRDAVQFTSQSHTTTVEDSHFTESRTSLVVTPCIYFWKN